MENVINKENDTVIEIEKTKECSKDEVCCEKTNIIDEKVIANKEKVIANKEKVVVAEDYLAIVGSDYDQKNAFFDSSIEKISQRMKDEILGKKSEDIDENDENEQGKHFISLEDNNNKSGKEEVDLITKRTISKPFIRTNNQHLPKPLSEGDENDLKRLNISPRSTSDISHSKDKELHDEIDYTNQDIKLDELAKPRQIPGRSQLAFPPNVLDKPHSSRPFACGPRPFIGNQQKPRSFENKSIIPKENKSQKNVSFQNLENSSEQQKKEENDENIDKGEYENDENIIEEEIPKLLSPKNEQIEQIEQDQSYDQSFVSNASNISHDNFNNNIIYPINHVVRETIETIENQNVKFPIGQSNINLSFDLEINIQCRVIPKSVN